MYWCRCEQIEAVWGGKEGDTYPGGDGMGGESQNHSPHYHFLHYAETDPLMDHTQGSNQVKGTPEECISKGEYAGRRGWQKTHRSTAHRTHKTVAQIRLVQL